MQKMFNVEINYNVVVLAEDSIDAIAEAKDNLCDEDMDSFVSEITKRSDVPYEWKNIEPYGRPDRDELLGTCSDIFDRIEEEQKELDRKQKIADELDRKQLKFDFCNTPDKP